MRRTFGLLSLAAALVALAQAGCGAGEPADPGRRSTASSDWQSVPRGPLGPRESALALWTGTEVLLIGGSDARPCPPTASCVPPEKPPLADGSAFDPQTGSWRTIAPSPVPFDWAQTAVIDTTAYLWIPGTPGRPEAERAFLAYDIQKDKWDELPLPPAEPDHDYVLAEAGDHLVAYYHTDEYGERPDFLFDAAAGTWSELPPDPLSPSFDRWIAWSGRELILFDHELVPNPGSEAPALTRAAALDIETGSWRRLPESEVLSTGPWVATGDGRLVNPTLGGADGGEVGNWGRTYPYGGILAPARGEWAELPHPPSAGEEPSAGVLSESGAQYFGSAGWIFDASANAWIEIPRLDTDGFVTGRAVVAAGDDLFVFGGARWGPSGVEAELLDDAYMWAPRGGKSP